MTDQLIPSVNSSTAVHHGPNFPPLTLNGFVSHDQTNRVYELDAAAGLVVAGGSDGSGRHRHRILSR